MGWRWLYKGKKLCLSKAPRVESMSLEFQISTKQDSERRKKWWLYIFLCFVWSKLKKNKYVLQWFYENIWKEGKKKFTREINVVAGWLTSYENIRAVHHRRRHNNSWLGENTIKIADKSAAQYLEIFWQITLINSWTFCYIYVVDFFFLGKLKNNNKFCHIPHIVS